MSSTGNQRLIQSLQVLNAEKYHPLASSLAQITLNFLLNATNYDYQGELSESAGKFDLPPATFKVVAQGVLVLLNDGESINYLSPHILISLIPSRSVSNIIVLNNGASLDYLRKSAIGFGLTTEVTQLLCGAWGGYTAKIANHLCNKIITKNRLIDLDWSFGVTAASDDCDHVGKTYLQLKLTIDDDASGAKDIFLELSLDQFYQFLASLEKCRTFLDFVSPR